MSTAKKLLATQLGEVCAEFVAKKSVITQHTNNQAIKKATAKRREMEGKRRAPDVGVDTAKQQLVDYFYQPPGKSNGVDPSLSVG
eukprot:9492855-Pyramimonas_sp.AAC.1